MKYGRYTKILHALIAATIALELMLSLVMKVPRPDRSLTLLQSFGYEAHKLVGIAVLSVLLLHWLMFASGHAYKGIAHFFPWASKSRRVAVLGEMLELLRFRVADPAQKDCLPGAIEGLGLAVASILAASGFILYFGIAQNGEMNALVHALKEFHEFWGPLMWGYLGVHTGAAALHVYLGHGSVLSIFRW